MQLFQSFQMLLDQTMAPVKHGHYENWLQSVALHLGAWSYLLTILSALSIWAYLVFMQSHLLYLWNRQQLIPDRITEKFMWLPPTTRVISITVLWLRSPKGTIFQPVWLMTLEQSVWLNPNVDLPDLWTEPSHIQSYVLWHIHCHHVKSVRSQGHWQTGLKT